MRRPLVVFAVLAVSTLVCAQAQNDLIGSVTAVDSPSSIRVDSTRVALSPSTRICTQIRNAGSVAADCPSKNSPSATTFYIGQPLEVYGSLDRHAMSAVRVVLVTPQPMSVSGVAIVDRIPALQPPNPKERTVRADGYLLHITPETKLTLPPSLKTVAEISTNQWIEYSGVQQPDGAVTVNTATIKLNKVSGTETKLRKNTEYNPAAVSDTAHQSGVSKFFTGKDYRRVPPWHDANMQARVERIGNSLVPAYQRAIPEGAPTKINFRFQVIDAKKSRDAINLPSGVIVVPYQVVDRMQNDDELAAVLADNIAETIEKDTLHVLSTANKAGAANIAGDVAGLFIPGVGLATNIASSSALNHVISLQLQQSGRVSLCLMHDAGYDIAEAPLAWWLLASKKPKPLDKVDIPPRARTLYVALGTTWHTSSPSAPLASAKLP